MDKEIILKHALKNAFEYGKADAKSVVGKVLAESPDAKKDMKATMALVAETIKQVNSFSKKQIEEKLSAYSFIEKKEEAKGIVLPNAVKGKVVTRFPPEPNGWPHIGHAKAAFLDMESARAYEGKFLVRFDDTNPEAEKQEFVEGILSGLEWLGIRGDGEVTYASDSLPMIYEHGKKLLAQGDAYACRCSQDEIKQNRAQGKECECRKSNAPGEHLDAFAGMLSGKFDEGDVIIRFKGDMASLNTVMRDPYLFRILKHEHYRQGTKYIVWPSYDIQAPIIDSVQGVTHAMRSKEYELRDELYRIVLEKLGLRVPLIVEFSRLSLRGLPLSKRLLKPLITSGKVNGWDDFRLPTLAGLRKRGLQPEAIKRFVLSFGLGKTESEPTIEALLAENKKILDPVSPRYFFVPDPIQLKVDGAPFSKAELKKHPSASLGSRRIEAKDSFFIPSSDAKALSEGEVFRLKDLYNVKVVKKGKNLIECAFSGRGLIQGSKKIQWVTGSHLACTVLVPNELLIGEEFNPNSLEAVKGVCESTCLEIKQGDIIQFERFGFCKLDEKKEKELSFIYTNP